MDFESKVLAKSISDILYETGKTLSTAESCTSGKIADTITSIPGASDYFVGSIVCYATRVKEELLGVSHELIEEKNVVSEEVVIEMVKGVCKLLKTDYAIAVTGVAGPSGGTPEIPVGTIWIACGTKDDVRTLKLSLDEGRERNLAIAKIKAMQLFVEYLKELFPQADLSEVAPVEAK